MQGDAGTAEEVVAAIGSLTTIPLELIGLREQLFALVVAFVLSMAETNVGICIEER